MPHSLLSDLLIVIAAAAIFGLAFEKLRLPGILGLLLAGVVLGPSGFKILSDADTIQGLAELGVALLMLTIGLEFSFERVRKLFKTAFVGGGLQILISIGISMGVAWQFNWPVYQGFVLGSVIALSSTAIVIKHLMDRAELDTLHGKFSFSVLVFQDLAVPFLLLLITHLGGSSGQLSSAFMKAGLNTALLFMTVWLASKYLIFPLVRWAAICKNREILFLLCISICLAISVASEKLGLSLAIGAFLAGLVLANTDFGFQFIGDLMPFRHFFVSVFFVSIGLLFDASFAYHNASILAVIVGLILFVNIAVVTGIALLLGYSPRIAIATGLLLCQIGEFSFVLIQEAKGSGGISADFYQLIIGASFISLFLSPILFALIPKVMGWFEGQKSLGLKPEQKTIVNAQFPRSGHIVVCGFGAVGRDISRVLLQEKIPFSVIEMNPSLIQMSRDCKIPTLAGDCANAEVLKRSGIENARAIMISFGDSLGVVQTLRAIRGVNRKVHVILRTRYESEIASMYDLGADLVILEEWEASLRMNESLLGFLKVPQERIQEAVQLIRDRQEFKSEEMILKRYSKGNHQKD